MLKMETKHTPTPWVFENEIQNQIDQQNITSKYNRKNICRQTAYEFDRITIEEGNANAHRIVNCVNACEGIPNESLIDRKIKDILLSKERELEILKNSNKYLTTGLIISITIMIGAVLSKFILS